jgi:hypothetical protein
MYQVRPNLVIGFHGCDEATCNTLLNHPNRIKISRERFDWLGNGMYFWENNYQRAVDWGEEKYKRGKITKPAVIGAVIDLGYCCDFLNTEHIRLFKHSYEKLVKALKEGKIEVYQNKDLPLDKHKDKILRELDCAVIEQLHKNIVTQIKEGY